jgi:hypothetical protein
MALVPPTNRVLERGSMKPSRCAKPVVTPRVRSRTYPRYDHRALYINAMNV